MWHCEKVGMHLEQLSYEKARQHRLNIYIYIYDYITWHKKEEREIIIRSNESRVHSHHKQGLLKFEWLEAVIIKVFTVQF